MKFANVFRYATRLLVASRGRLHVRTVATVAASFFASSAFALAAPAAPAKVDYQAVAKDIAALLDADFDDGSYGPILVRLAWHAAGTYDKASRTGGSDGATMRFDPEKSHGANNGLDKARSLLEPIKKKYPSISYADLWSLAGVVAIQEMGGPTIKWRGGRSDAADGKSCTPDGRLPNAAKKTDHLREIFYRMGFNDQEIVALSGAHCLGRSHVTSSGFVALPWTYSPITFTNDYFTLLLEPPGGKWKRVTAPNGNPQYVDSNDGSLMMFVSDIALMEDPATLKFVKMYAGSKDKFFEDFAAAFGKLLELGLDLKTEPITINRS